MRPTFVEVGSKDATRVVHWRTTSRCIVVPRAARVEDLRFVRGGDSLDLRVISWRGFGSRSPTALTSVDPSRFLYLGSRGFSPLWICRAYPLSSATLRVRCARRDAFALRAHRALVSVGGRPFQPTRTRPRFSFMPHTEDTFSVGRESESATGPCWNFCPKFRAFFKPRF